MLEPAGSTALLAIDPELGRGLDQAARARARELIRVRLVRLAARELHGQWGKPGRDLAGLLIARGALLREVTTSSKATAELLGRGDFIRPFGEDGDEDLPVRAEICWRVLEPVEFAPIDGRVLQLASRWPPVLTALMARCVERTQRVTVALSLSHMVRIRDRLLLLFWHLSESWGHVCPEGVMIDLPLTHAQLALMVGAERPSVSTALSQLTREGFIQRVGRGWRLSGPVPEDVGTLLSLASRVGGA